MLATGLCRLFGHKLMISNIAFSASAREVTDLIKSVNPSYTSLTVPESHETRSVKGYAIVEYPLGDVCKSVQAKLAEVTFMGRSLKVIYLKGNDDIQAADRPPLKHRNPSE